MQNQWRYVVKLCDNMLSKHQIYHILLSHIFDATIVICASPKDQRRLRQVCRLKHLHYCQVSWATAKTPTNDAKRTKQGMISTGRTCTAIVCVISKILKVESLWIMFPKQHPQYQPRMFQHVRFQLLLCPEKQSTNSMQGLATGLLICLNYMAIVAILDQFCSNRSTCKQTASAAKANSRVARCIWSKRNTA